MNLMKSKKQSIHQFFYLNQIYFAHKVGLGI